MAAKKPERARPTRAAIEVRDSLGRPMVVSRTFGKSDSEAQRDVADLAEAVQARRRAEAQVELLVQAARVRGASWSVIASVLGVTRQAAQKRYAGDALL